MVHFWGLWLGFSIDTAVVVVSDWTSQKVMWILGFTPTSQTMSFALHCEWAWGVNVCIVPCNGQDLILGWIRPSVSGRGSKSTISLTKIKPLLYIILSTELKKPAVWWPFRYLRLLPWKCFGMTKGFSLITETLLQTFTLPFFFFTFCQVHQCVHSF